MKLALSTDHAGFERLQSLKRYLESLGHECVYFGPEAFNPEDDYPDFIFPAAQAVASGDCAAGIIFGGSGEGEAIAANRVPGVRCTVYYGPAKAVEALEAEGTPSDDDFEILRLSREHNDANILSLAGRFLTNEAVEQAVSLWLSTPFSQKERHQRRIAKLDAQQSV